MFAEDLSVFMNVAEFADTILLNWEPVPALFDAAYALAQVGPYGMASSQPVVTLATAHVPDSPVGLPVEYQDKRYSIAAHEPDGTGISRLLLEVAA